MLPPAKRHRATRHRHLALPHLHFPYHHVAVGVAHTHPASGTENNHTLLPVVAHNLHNSHAAGTHMTAAAVEVVCCTLLQRNYHCSHRSASPSPSTCSRNSCCAFYFLDLYPEASGSAPTKDPAIAHVSHRCNSQQPHPAVLQGFASQVEHSLQPVTVQLALHRSLPDLPCLSPGCRGYSSQGPPFCHSQPLRSFLSRIPRMMAAARWEVHATLLLSGLGLLGVPIGICRCAGLRNT